MDYDTELLTRTASAEARLSLAETRLAVFETRLGVCESRIKSESGAMVRLETHFHNEMKELLQTIKDDRTKADARSDERHKELSDDFKKLSRAVWILFGGFGMIGVAFKIAEYLKHP